MHSNLIDADMPVNKLDERGAESISNSELLSIIIAGNATEALEVAKAILKNTENKFTNVARMSKWELLQYKGMTPLRASRVLALMEVGRRRNCEFSDYLQPMCQSKDVANFLKAKIGDCNHELFCVLYLNKARKVLHYEVVSKGGIDSTVVDVRIILKHALQHNAVHILLSHNHPSGSLTPSKVDIALTKQIKEAAELMCIGVQDHLIITQDSYYSFSDEGIL